MRRKSKIRILVITIFAVLLIFLGISYAILNQQIKITGKVTLEDYINENKGYNVTYTILNKWYGNNKYVYQISMTLENNTEEILDGWKVSIENPENGEILNYYNVNCTITQFGIEFSNVDYNSQVPSKGKVTFEFQIATTDPYYKPGNIIINDSIVIPPSKPDAPEEELEKKAEVKIKTRNQWGTEGEYYTQIKITIKNIGDTEIYSWKFNVNFQNETTIEQLWNANSEKKSEFEYTISNSDYNGTIQPNSEISIEGIIKTEKQENTFEVSNIILK